MYSINRAMIIVKPRTPFVEWANNLPDAADLQVTLEQIREDCHAYLIPEFGDEAQTRQHVRAINKGLFEQELWSWCTNPNWHPPSQDWQTFQQWFDIEIHSMVIDTLDEEIEKDEP